MFIKDQSGIEELQQEKSHASLMAPVIESFLSSAFQGVKPCEGPSHSSIRLPPPRTHEEDNL
jgi:hypothetical protein